MTILSWLRKSMAIITLAATAIAFTASGQIEVLKLVWSYADPVSITGFRLRHAPRETFIAEIRKAVAEEDFDDARQLVRLATESGHTLPPELVAATEPDTATTAWLNTRDFAYGAVTGDVSSLAALGGTLTADYLVVGDIRDVVLQGTRLAQGEDYDGLTLGLAALGLVTLLPGSGPIDLGLSLVKTANRTNKLSRPLRKRLTVLASDLIDTRALKQLWHGKHGLADKVDRVDPAALRKTLAPVIRPKIAAEIGAIARNTGELVNAGGVKATLRALEHVDDVATDLPRFTKMARRMGDNSSAVVRLFGKGAIRLGKLAYAIAGALLALLGWGLGLLWTVIDTIRNLRRLFARAA
ncbi:hypothetical protein [Allorhizobium borbori]|uniref:Uncharacterized protein n=1 Tax=Allorhizobium borbori TaxID=485907 RepID=A0A7W6NZC0_9HYPH|nr:hypothetical protein [Allorhizobium borbori]MBB4102064.1 hypothetical protein [Allorhizobium borbori]